jgi:hypothetical protein
MWISVKCNLLDNWYVALHYVLLLHTCILRCQYGDVAQYRFVVLPRLSSPVLQTSPINRPLLCVGPNIRIFLKRCITEARYMRIHTIPPSPVDTGHNNSRLYSSLIQAAGHGNKLTSWSRILHQTLTVDQQITSSLFEEPSSRDSSVMSWRPKS